MEDRPTVLFGWYDSNREEFSKLIEDRGYSVTSVGTLNVSGGQDGMLQLVENNEYYFWLMDANNLGFPGEDTTEGARKIYKSLIERGVEDVESRLYTFFIGWDQSNPSTEKFITMGKQRFIDDYIHGYKSF